MGIKKEEPASFHSSLQFTFSSRHLSLIKNCSEIAEILMQISHTGAAAADHNDLNVYDDEEFNYNELRSLRKFAQRRDDGEEEAARKSSHQAAVAIAEAATEEEQEESKP
jgi:hypothetical protein